MPQTNGNDTDNSTTLPPTSPGLIVESLFFGVLSLVILAGNTLVCTAIYKNRKLRTKTNYYLVSLAIADIMVGVFSVPYWVYFRLGKTNELYPARRVLFDLKRSKNIKRELDSARRVTELH